MNDRNAPKTIVPAGADRTASIPAPSRDILTEILHDGAQRLLAQATDAEVGDWIDRHAEGADDGVAAPRWDMNAGGRLDGDDIDPLLRLSRRRELPVETDKGYGCRYRRTRSATSSMPVRSTMPSPSRSCRTVQEPAPGVLRRAASLNTPPPRLRKTVKRLLE